MTSTPTKYFLLGLLLIFSCYSFAQMPMPNAKGDPVSSAMKKMNKKNPNATPPGAGEIRGRCIVDAGGSALVAGPCSETILVLNNSAGEEALKARTTREGNFNSPDCRKEATKLSLARVFLKW